MHILDTNAVIDNINNGIYEKGYIFDITLFERLKSKNKKIQFKRYKELKNYMLKSKSVMYYVYSKPKDVFLNEYPDAYGFKLAIKAAKRTGNYLGSIYIQICCLIAVCYIFKQNNIQFEKSNITLERKECKATEVCNALFKSLEIILKKTKNKLGSTLLNYPKNINYDKFELKYINQMIEIYNNKSTKEFNIPLLKNIDYKNLTNFGKLKYTTEYLSNIVNAYFSFSKNNEVTKTFFLLLIDDIFKVGKFEFNHICDMQLAFSAYKKKIKIITNDISMKRIYRQFNLF